MDVVLVCKDVIKDVVRDVTLKDVVWDVVKDVGAVLGCCLGCCYGCCDACCEMLKCISSSLVFSYKGLKHCYDIKLRLRHQVVHTPFREVLNG